MNKLTLNFLKLSTSDFSITCFRRQCLLENETSPGDDFHRVNFSERTPDGVKVDHWFWISIEQREGFEPFSFIASKYVHASLWILRRTFFVSFAEHIKSLGTIADFEEGIFKKLLVKVVKCCGEYDPELLLGYQGFRCEMEWLPSVRAFGIIVNFHFFPDATLHDSRLIQKLSFSIDNQGNSNRDFHAIRRSWLRRFREKFTTGFTYTMCDCSTNLSFESFVRLEPTMLPCRQYRFGHDTSDLRPYWGVKKNGPYREVKTSPTYIFVFREHYRQEARQVYRSLAGTEFPDKFSGMKNFFHVGFSGKNVIAKTISEESITEYRRVAAEIVAEDYENPVCIVLHSGDAEKYYCLKTILLKSKIPSQVIEISTVGKGRSFQWAVAGLGVQIFSKSGGYPWCVSTSRKDTLIVGLSQIIDQEPGKRARFIAYSIASDASGIFKNIKTLSTNDDEKSYEIELARNLKAQLMTNFEAGDITPSRIVLHCSFRLKRSAMEAVRRVVADCRREAPSMPQVFVLRVNTTHPYFGFDDENASCVPPENALVRLGRGRYLFWTEGYVPGRSIIGRISNPILISFDHVNEGLTRDIERELLEDIGNLAGANWRGFQARSRPVSVLYSDLVGEFIHNVREYSTTYNLSMELPPLEQFVPWFL